MNRKNGENWRDGMDGGVGERFLSEIHITAYQ